MRKMARGLMPALFLLGLAVGCVTLVSPSRAPITLVEPEKRPITGLVCERDRPVARARVRIKGRAESVVTDDAGKFSLPRKPGDRVTAWLEGYLIAGTAIDDKPVRLNLLPLPKHDNADYQWISPDADAKGKHNCANCHGEIYREWNASGHARSATGKHFRSLYLGTSWDGKPDESWGLLRQYADGAGVCTACHAPTVPPGDPAQFDLSKAAGVSSRGVHCDYCHKVNGVSGDKFGLTHGRDMLTLLRPNEGQLFFGPLDDVDRGEDAYSPFYRDSKYCAACHEGIVFSVHVYSTYSEWRDSPAAKRGQSCQDCHMKPTGTMTNIAPGKGGIERDPKTLANHRFFVGSREEMLRGCLDVSVKYEGVGDKFRATVSVRADNVGHRVPTGFVDRHLILVVEGADRDGKPVAPLGGKDQPLLPPFAGPELAGKPGKVFAKLLKDSDGKAPVPFWRAGAEPTDTRLRPGETERVAVAFPVSLHRVRVRLVYRRFWQEVAKAKGFPDGDTVVFDRTFVR